MRILTPSQLHREVSDCLGLPTPADLMSTIKASLRRAAFILAPANRADLIRFVKRPLAIFCEIEDELIEYALDELIVYGEILEMHRLLSDPWHAPAYVLRPAPPSFVRLHSGVFAILGVAGDHSTPLTIELQDRVEEQGPIRRLQEIPGEDLGSYLRLLGLVELSEQAWLRTPTPEPAVALVSRWRSALEESPSITGIVEGLEIISNASSVSYYRGRWTAPKLEHSGVFVGRRPQVFGGPVWSFVELENGALRHIVDISPDDYRQRPCDLAWRLQAALDASSGTPQLFRVRSGPMRSSIDFYSPLPAFAERKLGIFAKKSRSHGCLYTFELPNHRLDSEVNALSKNLWMCPSATEA